MLKGDLDAEVMMSLPNYLYKVLSLNVRPAGGEEHEQGHGELREAQLRRGHYYLGHCAEGAALLWC